MNEWELYILAWKKWLAYWLIAIDYYFGWWLIVALSIGSLILIALHYLDWSALGD